MSDSPLDRIRVAAPCTADWNRMYGDERVRFCRQCNLNVYNLSGMTREEAETLIFSAEGRLCVRFYRRKDGTVLTQNCPVGFAAIKKRVSRIATAVVSATIGFFVNIGFLAWILPEEKMDLQFEAMGLMAPPDQYSVGYNIVPGDFQGQVMLPLTVRRSENFIRNRAVTRVQPEYPVMGRLAISGTASVAIKIAESGEVTYARAVNGHPILRTIAIDAARQWKFKPLRVNGAPVAVESTLTFTFEP